MKHTITNLFAKGAAHTPPCCSHLFFGILMLFTFLMPTEVWGIQTPPSNNIFIVGSALEGIGWDANNTNATMTRNGNVYTWTGTLKTGDGFKFLTVKGQWNKVYGPAANNDVSRKVVKSGLSIGDYSGDAYNDNGNFYVPVKGKYRVTIDFSKASNQLTCELLTDTEAKLYLIGSGTNAGWTTDKAIKATSVDGVFVWNTTLKASDGNEFKFLTQGGWDNVLLATDVNSSNHVDITSAGGVFNIHYFHGGPTGNDDKKFYVVDGGNYTIVVDPMAYKMYAYKQGAFTLSYNKNAGDATGSAPDGAGTKNFYDDITAPANTYSRSGYTFTGWNTQANGSGTAYAANATFRMPAQNVTLYAQWEALGAPASTINVYIYSESGTPKMQFNGTGYDIPWAQAYTASAVPDMNNWYVIETGKTDIKGYNIFTGSQSFYRWNITPAITTDLYFDMSGADASARFEADSNTPAYETLTSDYYLRGDLWLDNAGWTSSNLPTFTKAADNKSATLKVLQPNFIVRFTLREGSTDKNTENYWDASAPTNVTNTKASGDKTVIDALGSTKLITYTLTKISGALHLTAVAEDYTSKKSGWKLYVDGSEVGTTNANGEVIVPNLNGEHTFYFTDGSAAADLRFGVNKFGGLYVDQTNSDASLLSLKQYYKSGSIGSFTAPISNENDATNGYWNATGRIKLTANSDVKFTFDGGKITINKVAAVTLPDNLYVYGCGGTNFFNDCWKNNLPAYKMTVADGEATYTFNNVSGSTSMKIRDHEANVDRDKEYITEQAQSMTTIIKSISKGSGDNNINLSLNGVANLTIHYNGTKIWFTAERVATPVAGNEWYIMGSGNSWDWNKGTKTDHNRMTITDGVASVSYTGVSGNLAFKVFRGSDNAEFNCSYYDAETSIGLKFANLGSDNICLNGLTHADVTIYWDGTKIWTEVVDKYPWTSDTYKDWYLTGDFTNPGVFDAWVMNPAQYKFTDVDAYTKTCSVIVDPSKESIVKPVTNNGITKHLTRFEIIRQGTWDNPRINKPHFDAEGSYDRLYTDFREAGSNRMALDVPQLCRLTFTIWRAGTTDADRRVTVTMTPVEMRTVTFKDGGITKTVDVADGATVSAPSFDHRGTTIEGWYEDAACTQKFNFSTAITADKTLYAKANGASGNYFLTGAIWHNWTTEDKTPKMTVANGIATYTFIAPVGNNTIRTLKGSRNEGDYIDARYFDAANSSAGINISGDNKQLYFTIADKPKQVTVTFDGRIKVTIEDYSPHFVAGMYLTANENWAKAWQANGTKADINGWAKKRAENILRQDGATGYIILRDVKTGHHQWKLLATGDDSGRSGVELFNALYVDVTSSSAADNFEWVMGNVDRIGRQLPYDDGTWLNIKFNIKKQCQLKIVFDGGLIKVMDLPQYTVSFNTNGGSAIDAKTVYEEERVSAPANPTKPLCKFVKWQLNGEDFDFANTPITGNITLDAVYEAASLSLHGPLWRVSTSDSNFGTDGTPAFANDGEKATVSLVAPKGRQTFGILRDRSYTEDCMIKPEWDATKNSSQVANPTMDNMWFHFELTEASYITITYTAQNKVYVTVDPTYEKKDGTFYLFNYPNPNDKTQLVNGELILRNLPTSDKDFKITTESGDDGAINGVTRFGGPYVEYEGVSGLWATHTYYHDWQFGDQERAFPIVGRENSEGKNWDDKYWQNAHVHIPTHQLINGKADLKFSFDGKTIRVAPVEHVSVICKLAAEGETFATQPAFKGNVAVAPANPETRADGAAFVEWRKQGETIAFDWNTTIDEDITLVAFWDVLQDRVDDIEAGGTFTLERDYNGGDLVVNKPITIVGNDHTIGNLTVKENGNLNVSGKMTVQDFTIESSQTDHKSGQVFGANYMTVQGNAYFDLKIAEAHGVTYGWYAFTVPFEVSSAQGIYNANTGGQWINERDYAIMQYQGDVRAQGKYAWIKTHKVDGTLHPGTLYTITLGDTEYNNIRFKKSSGAALLNGASVAVQRYTVSEDGEEGKDNGWNGVGNATLTYANASLTDVSKAQVLDHENNVFALCGKTLNQQSFVVGSAFMVQVPADGNMSFAATSTPGTLQAPSRVAARTIEEMNVRLTDSQQRLQDQLYLSASEDASYNYEVGHDLLKFEPMGTAKVAQMYISGYGDMHLCDAEFPLVGNQVEFPLVMTAPKAGDYTLSASASADATLYLLKDGVIIWNLTMAAYDLSLASGTNANYSLMLIGKRGVSTGTEQVEADAAQWEKILLNGMLYLRRGAVLYTADGKKLK